MCTVEVPTCRPLCLAEAMRKVNRFRNLLNRLNDDNNNENNRVSEENFQSARRVLFDDGPIDHEVRSQILARETERIRRDVSARWNFDFETETPLRGRFLWTPVFENVNPVITSTVSASEPASTPAVQPISDPIPELIRVPSPIEERVERASKRTSRQSKLTDYLPQRKRSLDTSPKRSKASHSPESKIRRRSTSTATTTA